MKRTIKSILCVILFVSTIVCLTSCSDKKSEYEDDNYQYSTQKQEDMLIWNSILKKTNNDDHKDDWLLEVDLTTTPVKYERKKTNSILLTTSNNDSEDSFYDIETEINNAKDLLTEDEFATLVNAYETREKWISEDYLYEDENTGALFISGVDEEFTTQANLIDFSVRQVKIWKWYLPIGYDLKINNVALGYSILTVAFGVRITKIVNDFRHLIKASINPKYLNSSNQAVRELAQGMEDSRALVGDVLVSLYGVRVILTTVADAICECKIPMWMFDYMGTAYQVLLGLFKVSWFNFAFTILQTFLPTISDAVKMINGLINSKTPTLHYTLTLYTGYSLS